MRPREPSPPQTLFGRARGSLHDRFGWHLVDHGRSHWDVGEFVSDCSICRREMIKRPGEPWRIRSAR